MTHRECHAFDPTTNSWSVTGSMGIARHWGAASAHPDLGLIVTGGGRDVNSTESTSDGGCFRHDYPDMGRPGFGHCQVGDGDRVFVTGGIDAGKRFEVLNLKSRTWSDGNDLPEPRVGHGCGLAVNPTSGKRSIVVAGGRHSAFRVDVDVLDLDTMRWTTGNLFLPTSKTPVYK